MSGAVKGGIPIAIAIIITTVIIIVISFFAIIYITLFVKGTAIISVYPFEVSFAITSLTHTKIISIIVVIIVIDAKKKLIIGDSKGIQDFLVSAEESSS